MTDSEIIKLLKKDAEQGLAELMQSYTGLVCSVIKGASPLFSAEDIEELAGDVFFDFYRNARKYDPARKYQSISLHHGKAQGARPCPQARTRKWKYFRGR
jgi:hypothetical protein